MGKEMTRDEAIETFDKAGKIGVGVGLISGIGTYSLIRRVNKYLVDNGYGAEYSLVNTGVKFTGATLGLIVWVNAMNITGLIKETCCSIGKAIMERVNSAGGDDEDADDMEEVGSSYISKDAVHIVKEDFKESEEEGNGSN